MLSKISFFETVMPWGEGVLPYKRLMVGANGDV